MKNQITSYLAILTFSCLGLLGHAQVAQFSTHQDMSQTSFGGLPWNINTAATPDEATLFAFLLIGSSETLTVDGFDFGAVFGASDLVTGAALNMVIDNDIAVGLVHQFDIEVIVNGTTVYNEPSSGVLNVAEILEINIGSDASGWNLTGINGGDLNTNNVEVKVVFSSLAGVDIYFNVTSVELGFATGNAPLPVTYSYLEAQEDQGNVQLKWGTAQESNNDYFEIQRAGVDKKWQAIARVAGAGSTTEVVDYVYTDKPGAGLWYYRLQQVDFDGQSEYSRLLSIHLGEAVDKPGFVINNPVQDYFSIHWEGSPPEAGQLLIFDQQGALVSQQLLAPTKHDRFLLPADMQAGQYWAIIKQADETLGAAKLICLK